VASLISNVENEFGRIDVLHYNAASMRKATILEQPRDTFNTDVAVNISGALVTVQAVVPKMSERGAGSILLTGRAQEKYQVRLNKVGHCEESYFISAENAEASSATIATNRIPQQERADCCHTGYKCQSPLSFMIHDSCSYRQRSLRRSPHRAPGDGGGAPALGSVALFVPCSSKVPFIDNISLIEFAREKVAQFNASKSQCRNI
jgi:hypothetical protein